MKEKKIKTLLSAVIITTLLGGCGTAQNLQTGTEATTENSADISEGLPSGTVELTVWAEETQFDTVQKMIDSFEENYAGKADFEITLEPMSDGETKNSLLADVQNGADVFCFPDDQLNSLAAAGALDVVTNESVKNANLADAVTAASINDILYAYPMTADNGYFLYYDKNYFSPEDVKTMDSILSVCQENGKKISMDLSSGWYLYSFFGNTGLEMKLNDDGITNNCNWNSEEGNVKGVDIAEALLSITQNPAFVSQADDDFIAGAKKGSVIAGVSGTWNAKTIKDVWGTDYGACKLPTYTCNGQQIQMASFKGYKMIGVNYYSKNKAWAHMLADWMTNEQNQTLRFEEQEMGPANINAANSDTVNQVPAIAAVIDQAQYGTLQRVGNNYWDSCTSFANTITAGNPDHIPLQELMDKLVTGITEP